MGAHRSTQQFDVRYTLPLPMGMTPETALIARLMGVSMTTLTTTKARPGDKVIVSGAGPVGFLAAHQFHISGYDVHVVEPNERRRAQLAASGLTKLWAAMPLDNKALLAQVALVVDCSGHEGAVLDACRIVRQQGEVVLIGVPWRAQTSILAHEILQAVFTKYVVLRSGWEWEFPLHGRSFVWEELYEGYNNAPHSIYSGFRKAFAWLEQGRIPLAGLMRKFPPTDPDSLYAALTRREIDEPFVVLDWLAGG